MDAFTPMILHVLASDKMHSFRNRPFGSMVTGQWLSPAERQRAHDRGSFHAAPRAVQQIETPNLVADWCWSGLDESCDVW
jgi:hypothetical protein